MLESVKGWLAAQSPRCWTPIVLAVAGVACGGADSVIWRGTMDTLENGAVLVRNPAEGIWTESSAWQLVERLRIGTRDDGPGAFGEVRDFDVDRDGRMYVLDFQAQQIRVFSPEGHYIRTIGRLGGGPGEFRSAVGIAFDPAGRLWVMNQGNTRYSVFDTTGTLLKELPRFMGAFVTTWEGVFDRRGALYDVFFFPTPSGLKFPYARYDTTIGQFVDTLYGLGSPGEGPPFWGRKLPTPHGFWVGVATDYRVTLTDFAGDTLRIVERRYEPIPLPKRKRDTTAIPRQALREARRRFPELLPEPDYQPIFQAFVEDDRGYLWVMLTPPADTAGSHLDVFDPAGRYLGMIVAPYHLEHEPRPIVRGATLYALVKDELDVPYVATLHIQGRE